MSHPSHDPLSADRIRALLGQADAEVRVEVHPLLDSTNTEAKRRIAAGDRAPALIVADAQSGGRGRLGRSFFSPAGAGIYMTYLYTPTGTAADAVAVTTAASVAVVRALRSFPALRDATLGIKWVNDIYLDGKKLCGILTEAVTDAATGRIAALAVGIGLNVRPTAFPPELAGIATCLGARAPARDALIARILTELQRILRDRDPYAHMGDYRACSLVIGRRVNTIRAEVTAAGLVLDIDGTGGLIVRRDDGRVETIHSGEVSLRWE